MSDMHRAAVAMLKEFVNQRALAVEMIRVLQAVEEAPAEMGRATKRIAALRKEMADLEDEKDKLAATVAQAKIDAKAELDAARARLETETAALRAAHQSEEQAAAKVRRERKLAMEAEEARHQASLDSIKARIGAAKEMAHGDQPGPVASGGADGGVGSDGNVQRKLGRPRGRPRLQRNVQRASDPVSPERSEQRGDESPRLEGGEGGELEQVALG